MGKERVALEKKSQKYLNILCKELGNRSVGSAGNLQATDFLKKSLKSFGWDVQSTKMDVIDWEESGASLEGSGYIYEVFPSPYSLGCDVKSEVAFVSTIEQLKEKQLRGKIVLLHGEIAKQQLMPKNFVFYNPLQSRQIVSLLEKKQPLAIISATARNSALAGGVYPFPLIEDGDFDIPSVYMTQEEGDRLLRCVGGVFSLKSHSRRIPSLAYNVVGTKGANKKDRIVITAHIDAKKGTQGAIDNATGVVVLLLVAEFMKNYDRDKQIEIVAFNGEDYFAASGQMDYIAKNRDRFKNIVLNINIDGVGYSQGQTSFSPFGLDKNLKAKMDNVIGCFKGIVKADTWPQGDHSIFVQQGCPAIAVSSSWLVENMATQSITHTKKDNTNIVDCPKLVDAAQAIWLLVDKITDPEKSSH